MQPISSIRQACSWTSIPSHTVLMVLIRPVSAVLTILFLSGCISASRYASIEEQSTDAPVASIQDGTVPHAGTHVLQQQPQPNPNPNLTPRTSQAASSAVVITPLYSDQIIEQPAPSTLAAIATPSEAATVTALQPNYSDNSNVNATAKINNDPTTTQKTNTPASASQTPEPQPTPKAEPKPKPAIAVQIPNSTLPEADQKVVESLLNEADTAKASNQPDIAILKLQQAQRIAPHEPKVYAQLAAIYLAQGKADRAEPIAHKGLNVSTNKPKYQHYFWRLIAASRRFLGDDEGERNALTNAKQY